MGTLKTTKDLKSTFKFGEKGVRSQLGMDGQAYPENASIYLPEHCPKYWECIKLDDAGAAMELHAQKITMDDVEPMEMKQDMDLPMTVREQLQRNNENRYLRLRLVNDYHQLQEWMTAYKNDNVESGQSANGDKDSGTIRGDYAIGKVAERNPQYAQKVRDVLEGNSGNEVDKRTLAELIAANPQLELDLAGITQ